VIVTVVEDVPEEEPPPPPELVVDFLELDHVPEEP
jgi:hypothetical protein